MKDKIIVFSVVGLITLVGNWVGYGVSPIKAFPGMVVIALIAIIGYLLSKIIPIKLPAVFWVALLAILISSPIFPGHAFFTKLTDEVNILALATPILAYAGLSFGKDIGVFKKLSWRIVVVSLVVFTGTFLFAAILSEFSLRLFGKI
ncbi:hypothetical protein EV207_10476 [Scopulibacillus darangshiensis]|uniref:Uncharacterized protein n=1 Tax=Scopulibacillus darangshiensis TaxID=442528 RepID=A0A4R2P7V5_9BACL|nr:hypothetical protein [Scopulibacillus darangshiensis]TCP30897.1 hypothetical protein EV207_10476 [Scopulibacillus darangshiensis]